jgi:hypothetical protein
MEAAEKLLRTASISPPTTISDPQTEVDSSMAASNSTTVAQTVVYRHAVRGSSMRSGSRAGNDRWHLSLSEVTSPRSIPDHADTVSALLSTARGDPARSLEVGRQPRERGEEVARKHTPEAHEHHLLREILRRAAYTLALRSARSTSASTSLNAAGAGAEKGCILIAVPCRPPPAAQGKQLDMKETDRGDNRGDRDTERGHTCSSFVKNK